MSSNGYEPDGPAAIRHYPVDGSDTPSRPDSAFYDPNQVFLPPPTGIFVDNSINSSPRGSAAYSDNPGPGSPRQPLHDANASNNSVPLLPGGLASKEYADSDPKKSAPLYKRPLFWLAALIGLVLVAAAVIIPVYFTVIRPNNRSASSTASGASSGPSSGGSGGGPTSNSTQPGNRATTGGDGSLITTDDGSTFTYHNPFGGYWVSDPNNPFDTSARPNSWTPPLNTSWTWGKDRINGVNLGGLFVLEPFISPAMYEQNSGAVDEWTLSTLLAAKGNLSAAMEDHYNTFITEEDIAQIAGAGLNWIRVPIPFWAIETWDNVGVDDGGNVVAEPFLAKVCWKYILRLLGWARKYGLRVNLDLHTIPGSQNGYNHSGKIGMVNFMNGVMGVANAERALDYIRIITEFISQPEYKDVIPMFGIMNEALAMKIGKDQLTSFYLNAHDMIRGITGIGAGNGPMISIHDGFLGLSNWANFLQGSDRIIMDTHPYFAFDGQPNTQPINVPADGGDGQMLGGPWPKQACSAWGASLNSSRNNFGVTVAGEFSNGYNACGLFLTGVGNTASYTGDCTAWLDASQWDANTVAGLKNFALASMDALGDWFFWTWKIGNSTTTNSVQSPLWSYKLGLQGGWIPTDPRTALGMCAKLGVPGTPFGGTFQPWQTGGAGAGTIVASSRTQFGAFPPTSMAGVPAGSVSLLPTYTPTKSPIATLPPTSFAVAPTRSVSVGNGWVDAGDQTPMVTAVGGCNYVDAWGAATVSFSAGMCGAAAAPTGAAPVPAPGGAATSVPGAVAAPSTAAPTGAAAAAAGAATVTAR